MQIPLMITSTSTAAVTPLDIAIASNVVSHGRLICVQALLACFYERTFSNASTHALCHTLCTLTFEKGVVEHNTVVV